MVAREAKASGAPFWQERTALLLGAEGVEKLDKARVLVVGLGGVGSWAAEFICRGGVGRMTVVDGDVVAASNRNRQLPALVGTEGRPKVEVMMERLRAINPDLEVEALHEFLRDERLVEVLSEPWDYVVDAIDALSQKVFLLATCHERGLRVVSSMGAGGRLDPTLIRVADIDESENCPLARMVRKRLHRLGIREGITVVYSPEPVRGELVRPCDDEDNERTVVGTLSCLPAAFGAACASVVLREVAGGSLRGRNP